jgi:hypothetical protein
MQYGQDYRRDLDLIFANPDGSPLKPDSVSAILGYAPRVAATPTDSRVYSKPMVTPPGHTPRAVHFPRNRERMPARPFMKTLTECGRRVRALAITPYPYLVTCSICRKILVRRDREQ